MKARVAKTLVAVAFASVAVFWIASEIRWNLVNDPCGKFADARQYLEHGRRPASVRRIERDGNTYYVTFGPMDYWLAVPSGPPAYVFDSSGEMVDWSPDIGDDPEFRLSWPTGARTECPLADFESAFRPAE